MASNLDIIRDLTRAKAVFQLRAICAAIGIPFDARNVETGRGNGNDCPTPAKPSIHQPLHHGSDSHGSVGSLGSIHGETNA